MFYAILLILLAIMITAGTKANVLSLEVKESAIQSDTQRAIWHELGAFNMLLLEFGPSTPVSFLAGMGVIFAYIGLWICALGNWGGLAMVIPGLVVCGLIQYIMVSKVRQYFAEYEKANGESPKKYFTGKNGLPHAVYTSVMIGIGKAVKLLLICSIVGISIYVILRHQALKVIDWETSIITGDFGFPPQMIYDEQDEPWICCDILGDEKNIRVYEPVNAKNTHEAAMKIYVDVHEALEHPEATRMVCGSRTFHW